MKDKIKIIVSAALAVLFVVLIVLLKTVDVAPNEAGGNIGLSHLNKAVFAFTGVNGLWDKLTDLIAVAAIAVAAAFAVFGLVQLIKRKSLLKVDREILLLGGLYVVVAALYFIFNKIVINYRPVIESGKEAEASFPSSHTMVLCAIFASAAIILGKYIKNRGLLTGLRILCIALMIIAVVGRIIAGVHWLTDVCGAVILSAALVALYSALVSILNKKKE